MIKRILPVYLLDKYHLILAYLANIIFLFPSRKLIVIGVTGTKGKTTTCNMIWQILTQAGFKVGMTTTANIKIINKEWINNTKMTMQGRFALQKILRKMVNQGCEYAVVETSSEGIKQHRHIGIKYQVGVFTNLSPEHIESHGSFENYKKAKAELFKKLTGQQISILNVDDEYAEYYKLFSAKQYIYYSIKNRSDLQAINVNKTKEGHTFEVKGHRMNVLLPGEFNIYNSLAAISVAKSQNIQWIDIIKGLASFKCVPGRMEKIESGRDFSVIVDYAHTPESLEAVYQTLKPKYNRLITVLGSCGGGRDKGKRPKLGFIAGKYADIAIITNEDPYDEDPEKIINDVWEGIVDCQIEKYKELDRAKAIKKAIKLAKTGDVIIITGKGSEQCIVTKKGKIAWDDRIVVQKYLK